MEKQRCSLHSYREVKEQSTGTVKYCSRLSSCDSALQFPPPQVLDTTCWPSICHLYVHPATPEDPSDWNNTCLKPWWTPGKHEIINHLMESKIPIKEERKNQAQSSVREISTIRGVVGVKAATSEQKELVQSTHTRAKGRVQTQNPSPSSSCLHLLPPPASITPTPLSHTLVFPKVSV